MAGSLFGYTYQLTNPALNAKSHRDSFDVEKKNLVLFLRSFPLYQSSLLQPSPLVDRCTIVVKKILSAHIVLVTDIHLPFCR